MKKEKIIIIVLIAALIVAGIIIGILILKPEKQSGIKYNADNPQQSEAKQIVLPCVESMQFIANQTTQKVNINNPAENSVSFDMTLKLIDTGETIWKCENLIPGNGFEKIELEKSIPAGTYDAEMVIKCFDAENGTQKNGGKYHLKIYVN